MGRCVFNASDVKELALHALNSEEWDMAWEEGAPKPGVLFVHDTGVYLMSNGIPRLLNERGDKNRVVYAESCDPDADDDYPENSRALVGGDDFVEFFNVDDEFIRRCDEFAYVVITVNENTLECAFENSAALANNG